MTFSLVGSHESHPDARQFSGCFRVSPHHQAHRDLEVAPGGRDTIQGVRAPGPLRGLQNSSPLVH